MSDFLFLDTSAMVRESSQKTSPPSTRGISKGWTVGSIGITNRDFLSLHPTQDRNKYVYTLDKCNTHLFSSKEYLLIVTSAKSPGALAIPFPGLANPIKTLGLKTSGPSRKQNSGLLGIWMTFDQGSRKRAVHLDRASLTTKKLQSMIE